MTDPTSEQPTLPTDPTDGAPAEPPTDASPGRRRPVWQLWAAGAGLVLLGVLVGAGAAIALSDDDGHGRWAHRQVARHEGMLGGGGPFRDGGFREGGLWEGGIRSDESVSGSVTAVSADSITVEVGGTESTYSMADETVVVIDGQPADVADLSVGDQVHLRLGTSGDQADVVTLVFARQA